METKLPLYKKLTVLYRIEPGCLGPTGSTHVEEFCVFAKAQIKNLEKGLLRWIVKPRYDKSLPELEYQLNNKTVNRIKADEFFILYDKNINTFEEALDEMLANLVEEYFERN